MRAIVQDGAPVLREVAKPVPDGLFGSAKLKKLVADMMEALDKEPDGVALAAPQVNESLRLFIVRVDRTLPASTIKEEPAAKRPVEVEVYMNPQILKTSQRRVRADEGCLSVRNVYGAVARHERVTLSARRPDGSHFTRGAGGLLAQIFEHETDHLNGILFTDTAENLVKIKHHLRFAYFGTPQFSTFVLDELTTAGLIPTIIVTTPDKPAGRGLAPTESPVKRWAVAHNIPLLQPEIFNEMTIATLRNAGCDTAVVAAYGKILPASILALFPGRAYNVHPSLLPRYRGTSPVESQILADEPHVGVSVILMDEEMDHGPIMMQEEIPQPNWPVSRSVLNERLWHAGGRLLARVLTDGMPEPHAQNHTQATFTKKIRREDGELNLASSGRENYLKYLAYEGWPGTYFFKDDVRYKITKASFQKGHFVVERVIPEGKREMGWS